MSAVISTTNNALLVWDAFLNDAHLAPLTSETPFGCQPLRVDLWVCAMAQRQGTGEEHKTVKQRMERYAQVGE